MWWQRSVIKANWSASPEFKGWYEELKGHVIDCGLAKHTDQFSCTMKEVLSMLAPTSLMDSGLPLHGELKS